MEGKIRKSRVGNMKLERDMYLPTSLGETGAYPKEAYGSANFHHGEILQGVYVDENGRIHRGLISLICDVMGSQATFQPSLDNIVHVAPAWKVRAKRAAELTLDYLNTQHRGGLLTIKSHIPFGWGLGSSTSDVTATIRAVANAFGSKLSGHCIADLAVRAEIASDPLMFGDRVVLFAHREGHIIEDLGDCLPPLEVLGFNTDPQGNGINTLAYKPARYGWRDIEAFRTMIGLMRRAVQVRASHLVGRVASASARINQQHLPKPCFDKLERLADDMQAVGLQVAHSGTVAGFLFDPQEANTPQRIECSKALLAEMGFILTSHFKTKAS